MSWKTTVYHDGLTHIYTVPDCCVDAVGFKETLFIDGYDEDGEEQSLWFHADHPIAQALINHKWPAPEGMRELTEDDTDPQLADIAKVVGGPNVKLWIKK